MGGEVPTVPIRDPPLEDGAIPDAPDATSTIVVSVAGAERLLDLVPSVPTVVWGRDEFGAGVMWNSNSVTAWLLHGPETIVLPHWTGYNDDLHIYKRQPAIPLPRRRPMQPGSWFRRR